MDTVEYPALSEVDRPLVDRYAVGLDADAARVLTYLRLRREHPGTETAPATRLEIRIGTGLSRGAVGDALDTLESLDLVTATSVRRHESGRPPQAWTTDASTTPRRVYERHAHRLFDRAGPDHAARPNPDGEGSDDGNRDDGEDDDDGDREPESLTVALNWHPNALHAPLYAGSAHGHYADGSLNVTFDPRTGSAAALDALSAGEVDVALVGAATFVASDREMVPLALLYERAMAVLYTTREAFGGPFERVRQLRDRRVGMSVGSETARLARLLLSQVDSLDAVDIVDLDGEERDALRSGRVDAVTGQVSDPDRIDDATVDTVPVANQFPLYGPVLVTSEETLDRHVDAVHAFLVGTMCGWADATGDPLGAAAAVPDGEDDERARETIEKATEEFGFEADHGWGEHTETGWERLRTALAHVDAQR
ncbi:ABC transporter substrate-binding protein [Halolamina salifodinae]|uniref:Thiamine pyrimidine synthase n=1 Tax=Halolamina salifodinae TaxID=1202767 RepID=A0A8T4GWM9_9EURY|nr:ABC transporter substrate-binding protein [Halolamina salifodinae]MBP1987407.1 ABC-type nitrate/sulfonate/bicarbonate transport system substrate-binding protein [Halolamina salifodinae]